mgnify:FL=1
MIVERATSVAQYAFLAYLGLLAVVLYGLFVPSQCSASMNPQHCLPPVLARGEHFDLWVYASPKRHFHSIEGVVTGREEVDPEVANATARLVMTAFDVKLGDAHEEEVTVPAAAFGTRANGTLYAHVLMYPSKGKARPQNATHPSGEPLAVTSAPITKHLTHARRNYTMLLGDWTASTPSSETGSLGSPDDASSNMTCDAASGGGDGETDDDAGDGGSCAAPEVTAENAAARDDVKYHIEDGALVTHIRPRLSVFVVGSPPTFPRSQPPPDITIHPVHAPKELAQRGYRVAYRPLVAVDEFTITRREYAVMDPDPARADPTMTVNVRPLNIGLFRMMSQMVHSMDMMQNNFGMSESDLDELKEMFTGQDWRYLALTFGVSILHSWFAFLAFKNDIGFWKQKSNLEGLSVRTQWTSFVCQLIIFANLMDRGQSSWIIVGEMGVSVCIEGWKVTKFLARDGVFHRLLGVGAKALDKSQMQKDTELYDKRAMRFLSYLLYPVVLAYGGYSLFYHPQRSWRSWVLRTLANGVYMFGFIAMTPQLYINYRLKSVAHLPWKAFMYKAFNTFIDDVFAFAIAMPTIHRLACLRDDLVFFVYLYQRWLYPVDKKRVNEFGRAYETDENGEEKKEIGEEEKAGEGETAEDNPPEPKGSEEKKND